MKINKEKYFNKAADQSVDLEILSTKTESFECSFQKEQMDGFQSSNSQSLGFRLLRGNCEITSFSENFNEKELDKAFDLALENLDSFPKEYQPKLYKNDSSANDDSNLFYKESPKTINIDQKIEMAKQLEKKFYEMDSNVTAVPYGGYSDYTSVVRLQNSLGTNRTSQFSGYSIGAYPLLEVENDKVMKGAGYSSLQYESLNLDQLCKSALDQCQNALQATQPSTGVYNLVMKNTVAQSLIGLLVGHLNGKQVKDKKSLLKDRLGELCFSKSLDLKDLPMLEGASGSRAFDSEGFDSRPTDLVNAGKVSNFLSNSVIAAELGIKNSFSAVRSTKSNLSVGSSNIVMEKGDKDRTQLFNELNQGIYITEFKGLRSGYNSASGDFSVQAEGFLIENGTKKAAVKDFVVSGNIIDCFKEFEASNNYHLAGGSMRVPDILIPNLSVAGK
ncbi:MAG: TldD/PmbA family protein [Bdellovibrionales bacterium]